MNESAESVKWITHQMFLRQNECQSHFKMQMFFYFIKSIITSICFLATHTWRETEQHTPHKQYVRVTQHWFCAFVFLTSWNSRLGSSRILQAAERSETPALSLSPRNPGRVQSDISATPARGWSRSHTACPSPPPDRSERPDSAGAGRGGRRTQKWATVTLYIKPSFRCQARPPAEPPTSRPSPLQTTARRQALLWFRGCWISPEGSAGSCGRPTLCSRSVYPAADSSEPCSLSTGQPGGSDVPGHVRGLSPQTPVGHLDALEWQLQDTRGEEENRRWVMSHREISLEALHFSEVIMLLMKHPEINTQVSTDQHQPLQLLLLVWRNQRMLLQQWFASFVFLHVLHIWCKHLTTLSLIYWTLNLIIFFAISALFMAHSSTIHNIIQAQIILHKNITPFKTLLNMKPRQENE